MKYTLLLHVFFCVCSSIYLQGQEIDSSVFDSLGNYYFELSEEYMHNYDSCFYYTALARDNYYQAGNREMEVLSINALAVLRRMQERFMEADTLISEALRKAAVYQILSDLNYDYVLNTAGVIKQRKGDYKNSSILLSNALERHLNRQGTNEFDEGLVGDIYQTLGQNLHHTGDYDQSIKFLNKSYQIQSKLLSKEELPVVRILLSLGVAYRKSGQLTVAQELLTQGFETLPGNTRDIAVTNKKLEFAINLAEVLIDAQKYDEAIEYAHKALLLRGSNKNYSHGMIYERLGKALLGKGELQKSHEAFQQALTFKLEHYQHHAHHPSLALAYCDLGTVLLAQEDLHNSLKSFQEALKIISPNFTSTELQAVPTSQQINATLVGIQVIASKTKALVQYGKVYDDRASLDAALKHYEVISGLIQRNRQSFQSNVSKHILSGEVLSLYEEAIEVALALYDTYTEQEYLAQAFQFAEANKAAILLEELQANLALGQGNLPDSVKQKEENLAITINFLDKSILEAKENNREKEWIAKLEDQKFTAAQMRSQLIRQIEVNSPDYYKLKYQVQTSSLEMIQNQLIKQGQGLLEYFVGKQRAYVFLIVKDSIAVEVIEEWEACQQQVNDLVNLLGKAPLSPTFNTELLNIKELGHALYLRLLNPILNDRSTINSLILIPDRELGYLPFEILTSSPPPNKDNPKPSSTKYLLESYPISYAYSTQLLLQEPSNRQLHSARRSLLAYAPSFGQAIASARASCTSDELYSLQCSEGEVQDISAIWSGDAIIGAEATLSSFRQHAPNARILHLATHACIDEKNAERNKIFFSDQALTGIDLQAMKLQPDLTILSACNTGTGQLARGEGILSLARDFRLAGSPSTLTSLWSVDDCATSKIMTSFHQHLFHGKSKAEAIRAAKLDFLATADKEQSHPYFWAAFVQYGDISPLRNSGLPAWLLYVVMALAMVGLLYIIRKRKQSPAL